jgi:excisionase family DNA binding protein
MNQYLTVKEAAEQMRCSVWTVYGLVEKGALDAAKINAGRNPRILIAPDSIERWLWRKNVNV